jgi:aspartate racemase
MTSPPSPNEQRNHRVIGVIGGMGPEATVDLMRRVIAKTPARDDQDHVHLLVESNPKIPSRVAHLIAGTGRDPTSELVRIARNLETAGADALAMPCNTAHVYARSIREAVNIPLLDMVQLTVAKLAKLNVARVGLLASSAVHQVHLYRDALAANGMESVVPKQQAQVMELIVAVKRGDIGAAAQARLGSLTADFAGEVDLQLIACSELSVIAAGVSAPFLDSLEVLADEIVAFARALPTAAMR